MVSPSATQAARIVPTFSGDAARWEAVIRRDRVADGTFYDAVQTTGIYCRPAGTARERTVLALVGFQGRGVDEGVPPDFCHPLLLKALIFQVPSS